MSRYEWESGDIRLPSAAFAAFRRTLNEKYNKHQKFMYEQAAYIFPKVQEAIKGKTGVCLETEIGKYLQKHEWRFGYRHTVDIPGAEEISRVLQLYDDRKQRMVLKRPKKMDFKTVKLTNNLIDLEDATIAFQPTRCMVCWAVPENNHAIERAREHPIATEFFGMLQKVKWVRGTGGQIVGNDENNRDDRNEGGGGNYVTATYPPPPPTPVKLPSVRRW